MRRARDLLPRCYPLALTVALLANFLVDAAVSPFAGVRSVTVVLLLALATGFVARRVVGDPDRAALAWTAALGVAVVGVDPRVAALGVAALVAALALPRTRWNRAAPVPWRRVTTWMQFISTVVVLAVGIRIVQDPAMPDILYAAEVEIFGPRESAPGPATVDGDPDIYVVVLDGYLREDRLQTLFDFDNRPFRRALEQRGFDFAESSRSNYLLTTLSLPTMLAMQHVEAIVGERERELTDGPFRARVRRLMADSEVLRIVRQRGYETVGVSAGFEEVALRTADRFIDTGQMNDLEFSLLRATAAGRSLMALAPELVLDQLRSRVRRVLAVPGEVARARGDRPRFVWTHVPSPHFPFVFSADGPRNDLPDLDKFFEDSATSHGLTRSDYGSRYVDQIRYLNGAVIDSIDAILEGSAKPPLILVFSDHGSGSGIDYSDRAASDLDERTANLVALLAPRRSVRFDEGITLVNVFGSLTNGLFGTTIRRQPDDVYDWRGSALFDVVRITLGSGRS